MFPFAKQPFLSEPIILGGANRNGFRSVLVEKRGIGADSLPSVSRPQPPSREDHTQVPLRNSVTRLECLILTSWAAGWEMEVQLQSSHQCSHPHAPRQGGHVYCTVCPSSSHPPFFTAIADMAKRHGAHQRFEAEHTVIWMLMQLEYFF